MWKQQLEKVIIDEQSYDTTVNSGASQYEIEIFIKQFKSQVSPHFPEEYINVLRMVNGLEYNGFILYGIDEELLIEKYPEKIYGLIDMNLSWYENEENKQYIYLGQSNISWYVFDIPTGKFLEQDLPSGSIETEYDTVDELINKCLSDALL